MGKQVTFAQKDKGLVQKIEQFQKIQELGSFTEAVRLLCKSGLQMHGVVKNLK